MSGPLAIELSHDEALVLHDWLRRFHQRTAEPFEDQAEQRVLWNLECVLEKALPEVLDPRYEILLAAWRARVRDAIE